jgi:hypothetical protein
MTTCNGNGWHRPPSLEILGVAGARVSEASPFRAIGFSNWKVTFGLYLYNTDLIRKNEGLERQELLIKFGLGHLYWFCPFSCIMIIDDNFLNNRFFWEVICFPLGATLLLVLAWRYRKWFIKRWSDFKPAELKP